MPKKKGFFAKLGKGQKIGLASAGLIGTGLLLSSVGATQAGAPLVVGGALLPTAARKLSAKKK